MNASGDLDPRLHLEKVLAVPPERVFAEFVDAERLRRWWGPVGFTVRRLRFDAVEGTDYRLEMQTQDGDVFHIRGTFRAVEAPRRLTFSFVYGRTRSRRSGDGGHVDIRADLSRHSHHRRAGPLQDRGTPGAPS